MQKPIVRMAPSPTGNLHVGTARTALFNYLFAKRHGGTFILRIEDTDIERSTKEFEKNILEGLEWLGIQHDALYRQSERTDIYVGYVKKMIANGTAYVSKEEIKEEGQRAEVIRFKNPNKKIAFDDLVRGTVEFDTTELEDFVIARSVEEPLYHLAVVIDDHEMGVTHVIRGEDHISNTPRQILIQEAIGAARPIYAHIPLIFDSDRKKLSKRKHGEVVWVDTYRNSGYIPEAFDNFLAFLGWNPGGEREVYALNELSNIFDLDKVQKGGAVFDTEKLQWFNKEHLKLLPDAEKRLEVAKWIEQSETFQNNGWHMSDEVLDRAWKVIFERIHIWKDVTTLIDSGEFDYLFVKPNPAPELLLWKDDTDKNKTAGRIATVLKLLTDMSDTEFSAEKVKSAIWDYATEEGRGQVLWPMRVALSGKEKSPDPFVLSEILGKEEVIARLRLAQEKLV